jgi:hypothetical protein
MVMVRDPAAFCALAMQFDHPDKDCRAGILARILHV